MSIGGDGGEEGRCSSRWYRVAVILDRQIQSDPRPLNTIPLVLRCGESHKTTGRRVKDWNNDMERGKEEKRKRGTYRNKADPSLNPSARAKTASFDPAPKSLKANMALYLSNSGNFVFNKAVWRSGIDWGEEEGAGSIVGKSGLISV